MLHFTTRFQQKALARLATLAAAAMLAACADQSAINPIAPDQAAANRIDQQLAVEGAVYISTNAVSGNAVNAFRRAADGSLTAIGSFATGGTGVGGTGDPLTSQGAVALSPDRKFLFVVNAGSNDVSVFRVKNDGIKLVDREPSNGSFPVSIATTDNVIYVLNAHSNSVGIFGYNESGNLSARGTAALSANARGGTEVRVSPNGHWLDVTERLSNTIDAFRIVEGGQLSAPIQSAAAGNTPFGFQFTPSGVLVASEAGSASASSYSQASTGTLSTISGVVSNGGQAAPCWLIVDPAGRFAYTANAGGSSISGYAIAGDGSLTLITPGGRTGDLGTGAQPLDIDFGGNGRFLYVLENGRGAIGAFAVNSDGTLTSLGNTPGLLPQSGFMGLAAF